MKFSEGLQKLLPFGYLFLVIMGILRESVFYYQVGINILKYSTIMDILISPIATLTANPVILIVLLIIVLFSYLFPTILSRKSHKQWAQKLSSLKNRNELSIEEIKNHFTKIFIKLLAVVLLSFFVGIGVGEGLSLTKRIATDRLEYGRTLTYSTGESEEIALIGSNSLYFFYLAKGNKAIKITPIGAIKFIELTNNKMLRKK